MPEGYGRMSASARTLRRAGRKGLQAALRGHTATCSSVTQCGVRASRNAGIGAIRT